jgi:rhamnosyltransferase
MIMDKRSTSIAVLIATYNGKQWLFEQVESILQQVNVHLTLFVSDDHSTDGTLEYLKELVQLDSRVVVLPQTARMGSAGKNFYRLVCDVDTSCFDYVAFADQDDIWNLDKLSRHVELIKVENAECVSSNVMAFWPDGSQKLIRKSQPQKTFDFVFEAAGPGCSFLMTPWLVSKLREEIQSPSSPAKDLVMHDWLTYAICRAYKRRWVIDHVPSLMYRQHANNVIGANSGIKAILNRLRKINDGWYRSEVSKICEVVVGINSDPKLIKLSGLLKARTFLSQLHLLSYVFQARRKLLDRVVLGLSILLFVF